jgi:hypothetical protein
MIQFNPLNADLNPIRHLLALLGAHHILYVSRIRVNIMLPSFFSFFFFFFISTTLYEFWLAQLFSSNVSSLARSVSNSSLPSFSGHFSRRLPILTFKIRASYI